ncbi:MAG: hypothetical protein MJ213_02350 [Bacilli bacterium]|nr:hypothetical protein [Bacilli bacterium]
MLKSLIVLASSGLVVLASASPGIVSNASQDICDFFNVEDCAYSGKGISLEFTYTRPSATSTNTFNFMGGDNGWFRITDNFNMTFYTNGVVKSEIGNVIQKGGKYYFQLLFSDFLNHLNTYEGATGHEVVSRMYVKSSAVTLNIQGCEIIESTMNLIDETYIREGDSHGLKFKAVMPSVATESTYGMAIVPFSYIGGVKDNFIEYLDEHHFEYVNLTCMPVALNSDDPLYSVYEGGYYIQASLTNIKEFNYHINFGCVAYQKDANGNYTYAIGIKSVQHNLYQTCYDIKHSDKYDTYSPSTQDYIEHVIYVSDNHETNVSTANVKAYSVYNTEQVLKTAVLPNVLDTTIDIDVSKNEDEEGQIILNTPINLDKKYYVYFEEFRHEKDANAVIPGNAAKLSKQLYVNVESNWSELKSHYDYIQKNRGDLYGDTLIIPELGWFPEGLLPFDVAVAANENVLNNVNGSNNGIHFNINIPNDTKAGIYHSHLVIQIADEGTIALPVNLNVYDFELPEQNYSKFFVPVNKEQIRGLYGTGTDGDNSPYYTKAREALKDYGISPGMLDASYWQASDRDAYVAAAKKATLDPRINTYELYLTYDNVSLKVKYKKTDSIFSGTQTVEIDGLPLIKAKDQVEDGHTITGLETELTTLVEESTNEVNLLKKAMIYFNQADEPPSGNDADKLPKQLQNVLAENVVRRSIDFVLAKDIFAGKDEVKASLQNLKYFVTSEPTDLMDGSLFYQIKEVSDCSASCSLCYCASKDDIKYNHMTGYVPYYYNFDKNAPRYSELNQMLKDDEYDIWWYGCIQPIQPYASVNTNSDMIRMRVNKWLQYSYNIEGELYYMANRTQGYAITPDGGREVVPITDEKAVIEGQAIYEGCYGDGQLLYPVNNTYGVYDSNLYYIPSIRLTNIGESNDDYNYLHYAHELISHLSSAQQQVYNKRVDDILSSITTGARYHTTDSNVFNTARIALADLIDELVHY